MKELFDYQRDLAARVLSDFKRHRRVVLCSPTGSGKTVTVTNGILAHLPQPALWITHRRELVTQAETHLAAAGAEVTVCTIQAFKANGVKYKTVVVDEGHHVCAWQYKALFDEYPNALHLAITATPYRLDGVGLGKCGFSSLVIGPDILNLTQSGFLCPARTFVPENETDGAWRLKAAASIIGRHAEGIHNLLAYCPSVDAAESLARALRGTGIPAVCVNASTAREDRDGYAAEFRDGTIKVLCNHTIFTEGYDAPRIDCVVLNRLTQSRSLWKQMVGRGLRTHEEKKECLILDLAGNGLTHGSIYDREIYDLHGRLNQSSRPTHATTASVKRKSATPAKRKSKNGLLRSLPKN